MKKISYLLLAAAMTGLASCVQQDNADSPVVEEQPTEGKVIIKEINVGGVKNSEKATGNYLFCKGIILYNNGGKAVTLSNWGLAFTAPQNGEAANKNYDTAGIFLQGEILPAVSVFYTVYQPRKALVASSSYCLV